MNEFLAEHWLDITTTVLGLAYIIFEYKASLWMWLVGFLMQALGIVLYYQKGLYVDIFPMINYPTLPRKWVKRITLGISRSYSILRKAHYYSLRSFAEFFWFGAKYLLSLCLWKLLYPIRPKDVYISNILLNNGYGIMHRQDSVFPLGTIMFEGKSFSAPCNPDAYLSDLYRNYMEIPPKEKQRIHSVFIMPELI